MMISTKERVVIFRNYYIEIMLLEKCNEVCKISDFWYSCRLRCLKFEKFLKKMEVIGLGLVLFQLKLNVY